MPVAFEVTEHRPAIGPDLTLVRAEFRPTPGEPVHSNIFHQQLYPTGIRLLIDSRGRLVTEGGKLVAPLLDGSFPDDDPRDPFQRETFTRNNDAEMTANIEAYLERKLKAAEEGKPWPQHHKSTVNLQVGASLDDVHHFGSDVNRTTPIFRGGKFDASVIQDASARFTSVAIGQADTIDSATMVLTPRAPLSATTVNTNIQADDADDSGQIADKTDWDSRVMTTALAAWDSIGTWATDVEETSPSIVSVIQEIVDRGSWASGNALQLFWLNDGSSDSAYRSAKSYDHDTAKAPKLDIDFTAAGGTTRRYSLTTLGVG